MDVCLKQTDRRLLLYRSSFGGAFKLSIHLIQELEAIGLPVTSKTKTPGSRNQNVRSQAQ